MSLTFNMALASFGIDPASVRLLRHQTRGADGRTPYGLWRSDREVFDAYQAVQTVKNRARLSGALWASFVVTPDGRTLFVGLYSVEVATRPVPPDWPHPLSARAPTGEDELYDLTHVALFSGFDGRLYVDWGGATRSWIQRADTQDKPIVELGRTAFEPPFPGYSAFLSRLSEVETLPPTWSTALGAARGVYLLTCPTTREAYVGSAIGGDGFLGRWRGYAADGHGGNVKLRSREPADYQISILEVAGSLDSDTDILALESRWKAKLQSREMGLNAN